jgi:hypothetical protein
MRDPANWAIPLLRLFGVRVRLHLLYFVTVLLWLRFVRDLPAGTTLTELFCFVCLLPIPLLLVHEWGHVAAARMLGGDADAITIGPLGGLTPPQAPSHLRSQIAVALAGPVTSLLVCLVLTSASVGSGFVPQLGLTADPIAAACRQTTTGRIHTVDSKPTYYRVGSTEKVANPKRLDDGTAVDPELPETVLEEATLPKSVVWMWRANWLSLWLVIVNLAIAAVPFDVGRIVLAIASTRGDDALRAAVSVARFAFLFYIPIFLLVGLVLNETMLVLLAALILVTSARMVANSVNANESDKDESTFGYDFSQGYTSLEKSADEADKPVERKPPEPKLSFWDKRRKKKEAERVRKEAEQDQRDAQRVDELLEKIQNLGQASLSPEERQFLERMSLRYREMK